MEVYGQLHAPVALTPGKEPRFPFDRRLDGPKSRSGWKNLLLLPEIEPRPSSPYPIALRYTDWTLPANEINNNDNNNYIRNFSVCSYSSSHCSSARCLSAANAVHKFTNIFRNLSLNLSNFNWSVVLFLFVFFVMFVLLILFFYSYWCCNWTTDIES
jgi:hypothetical protein